ncbi:hypothetical protein ESB00_04465 [Oleiharenicola lentus]|uniref:Uncharacterized protein n=1 Tax=Oleiharenicola lentus TaxID=2508720 RepID=A0A4Q1C8I2_9BACT|nr:hypothetical protein [Oleiharenicola lentus]RXK55156.1 hypothetical protein ESB00_04465 [Oleiharenicola lentus]
MNPESSIPDSLKNLRRTRNKHVLAMLGFAFGLLCTFIGRVLARYEGPWGGRLALALTPFVLVGILALSSRRFYQADELELLINRKALEFAFYAAFFGLFALELFQAAGFVPRFEWTNKRLLVALSFLMISGILWTKRRYD